MVVLPIQQIYPALAVGVFFGVLSLTKMPKRRIMAYVFIGTMLLLPAMLFYMTGSKFWIVLTVCFSPILLYIITEAEVNKIRLHSWQGVLLNSTLLCISLIVFNPLVGLLLSGIIFLVLTVKYRIIKPHRHLDYSEKLRLFFISEAISFAVILVLIMLGFYEPLVNSTEVPLGMLDYALLGFIIPIFISTLSSFVSLIIIIIDRKKQGTHFVEYFNESVQPSRLKVFTFLFVAPILLLVLHPFSAIGLLLTLARAFEMKIPEHDQS
jgi:uncharacterized membrane protein